MKIHKQMLGRLSCFVLLPLLTMPVAAQSGGRPINIKCPGDGTVVIAFPASPECWIVVSSPSPKGPWTPCLEPITTRGGMHEMSVPASCPAQYFRQAQGDSFLADFEGQALDGWTVGYLDPLLENEINLALENGRLRVQGTSLSCSSLGVFPYRTNLLLADFSTSIDILGWHDNPESYVSIGLMARVAPGIVDSSTPMYVGGLQVRPPDYPGESILWFWEGEEAGGDVIGGCHRFSQMDPAKNYRLTFCGVGSQLTLQLLDLTDGSVIAQHQVADDTLVKGWVGIYMNERGPSGTLDNALDNFIACGTTLD